MAYTINQERAISLKDKNILVSAAAGSGKTSVLTERIFRQITDTDSPIDIDRMLIMTFTNAAAKEMRDRIRSKIEKALDLNPDDANLQRQSVLINNAQITTIHGFCQSLIRDHFEKINIDPNFRVGDENECKLLRMDVLNEVLEEMYKSEDADFLETVDSLSETKGDKQFSEMILKFYLFAQSSPEPDEYLDSCIKPYSYKSLEEFINSGIPTEYINIGKEKIEEAIKLIQRALSIIDDNPAIEGYRKRIEAEKEMIEALSSLGAYDEFREAVKNIKFETLSGVSTKGLTEEDLEAKGKVQKIRDNYKGIANKLKETYKVSLDTAYKNMADLEPVVRNIVKLVRLFTLRYSEKKAEKNIIDFNDMEHMAISILKNNKEVAEGLKNHFAQIYVDEYQDSNMTQETLLDLIRIKGDKGNLFMVGDVKQSIYRFRQARPDLFISKYDSFSDGDSVDTKVVLNDNFRSRREVIDSVNEVFFGIMTREVGGIQYDDAAALKVGATCYSEVKNLPVDIYKTEIILGNNEETGKVEFEANVIADRINKMIREKLPVFDADAEMTRPVEYKDIVILVRSLKGYSEVIKEVLQDAGIPVHVTSREGYFGTTEIRTTLAFLSVIDNPLQDIPLATVMKSPVFDFSNRQLSLIRAQSQKEHLYDSVKRYVSLEDIDEKLRQKCLELVEKIDEYRQKSVFMPVDLFLQEFIDKEYGDYVRSMDKGAQRIANLNMLVSKAKDYGKTSFTGLFNFVRYIDLIKKYEIDEGEAGISDEGDNVVRIMTIHKSKGLEFPVCFLAGLEKKRNQMDERAATLWDAKYGIGLNRVNLEKRVKYETIYKSIIRNNLEKENVAEEIRVLYVAMTRAREKLILVGIGDEETFLAGKTNVATCNSYLDMLTCANEAKKQQGFSALDDTGMTLSTIDLFCTNEKEIVVERVKEELDKEKAREELSLLINSEGDEEYEVIKDKLPLLTFTYPYETNIDVPSKLSVSELKHRAIEQVLEQDAELVTEGKKLFAETEPDKYIPKFMRSEGETITGGTFYGTAFHRILELWKYEKEEVSDLEVEEFAKVCLENNHMDKDQIAALNPGDIAEFLNSEIGKRLYMAKQRGLLFREQPFVIGVTKREVAGEEVIDGDEIVLVQGIIDAFVEEDDGIMILDYKTDHVGSENVLINRYRAQLEYYQKALNQITGKRVKELIIYSSCLKKAIML